jgi:hypothetical protein
MSRAKLVVQCKALGVRVTAWDGRRDVPMSSLGLRVSILERLYGPGFNWKFKSASDADKQIALGIASKDGQYGYLLAQSQYRIGQAMVSIREIRRLEALKTAASSQMQAKINTLKINAKRELELAGLCQNLHSVAVGIRDNKESEYREAFNV